MCHCRTGNSRETTLPFKGSVGAIGRTEDKDGNGRSSSFASDGAIALPVGRVTAKISPDGCVLSPSAVKAL